MRRPSPIASRRDYSEVVVRTFLSSLGRRLGPLLAPEPAQGFQELLRARRGQQRPRTRWQQADKNVRPTPLSFPPPTPFPTIPIDSTRAKMREVEGDVRMSALTFVSNLLDSGRVKV